MANNQEDPSNFEDPTTVNPKTSNASSSPSWLNKIDYDKLSDDSDHIAAANPRRYQGYVPSNKSEQVVETFRVMKKFLNKEDAFVAIAMLLQFGASNRGGTDQIEATFKGITVSARDLHSVLSRVDKKITARQFARTHASEIQKISCTLGIPGDLAKKRALEVGSQSPEEESWCSNFQTQNPACLRQVREWLIENYKSRFQA